MYIHIYICIHISDQDHTGTYSYVSTDTPAGPPSSLKSTRAHETLLLAQQLHNTLCLFFVSGVELAETDHFCY